MTIYFVLAVIYFLPAFAPGQHIFGTDYSQHGYIVLEYARQRMLAGELPKWIPHLFGGLPLFSNQGSVFYPLRVIANFIMPGTWVMPTIFVVHFAIAGIGTYLLSRELGARMWVAFLAGLAFQFTGITMSAVHAGHDGRIIVATIAPLFLYFLHRGVRTGQLAPFAGAAATLGVGLLSFQVQSNYYLLIAGAAWALFALVHMKLVRNPRALGKRVALGIGAVAFAFAVAAVNFLPFSEYVADSPRGVARGYEFSTTWSMPPVELLAMAVPEHIGMLDLYRGTNPFKLHTEYTGALVLLLLLVGAVVSRRSRYWWFFLGLSLFALSIAFGGHTPIYRLYYELLPGTRSFRAPSISFFLVPLALAVMAAITLEQLAQLRERRRPGVPAPVNAEGPSGRFVPLLLAAFALISIIGAVMGASLPMGPGAADGFTRFALFACATSLLLWLWWSRIVPTRAFVALIAIISLVDLVMVNRRYFGTTPAPEVVFAVDPLINFLMNVPKPARTWVVPAEGWQDNNALMMFNIEQAGGLHGNQLQRFNEYAGTSTETYIDWHNFREKSNFLNAANIRYLLTREELRLSPSDSTTLRERHRIGGFVYENLRAMPRAYIVGEVIATADTMAALTHLSSDSMDVSRSAVVYTDEPMQLPAGPLQGSVRFVENTPDRVVLQADASREGLLVLSDNWHKDWVARLNGVEVPILRANHTFRGVVVPAGTSELVFEFKPRMLYIGFYIYLVSVLLLTGYFGWLLVRRVRSTAAAT